MKKITLVFLCLLCGEIYSQDDIIERKIKTEVSEVTVFIKGAQITRKKSIDLKKGKTVLKFINLSPFIEAKSIQAKANGNVTVLSVNHQQNYIDKLEKKKELTDLELERKDIESKINLERAHLEILHEELAFLKDNRNIGGKNQELSATNLKEASDFYGSKLTSLKLKEIEINKKLENLIKSRNDLNNQIRTLTSKKEYPNGEILVKIDAKNTAKANLELSYVVGNSSWFPSYDIRAKNVNEPIELIYKANVKQDTKVDWKNIKLKLSSANPNISGTAPELKTYYLNYNTLPPVYNLQSNTVTGIVSNYEGPLPGATVIVKGTTIGTSTDFDGKYSITVPNNAKQLEFTYIGMETKVLPISNNTLNVVLEEDSQSLDQVVITGYSNSERKKSLRKELQDRSAAVSIRGSNSIQIPLEHIEKQTTVDFEIEIPYSIKSDNKSYAVDMTNYSLAASYQYYCVPKINKDAFLIASISDWEKYNLLEGEANIFFEDTYVGKSLLDIRHAKDSLQISLGSDKNIVVKREKLKDFTSKKFIGSKTEELRSWEIVVKNNKNQRVNMSVFDQVPVSTLDEIKVELIELSKAKHHSATGEIKWDFVIEPRENKRFDLKYSVKYPKHKTLIIE